MSEYPAPARRGPSNFRIRDVRRIVRALEGAGMKIGRVEVEGGRITVVPAAADAPAVADNDPVIL